MKSYSDKLVIWAIICLTVGLLSRRFLPGSAGLGFVRGGMGRLVPFNQLAFISLVSAAYGSLLANFIKRFIL